MAALFLIVNMNETPGRGRAGDRPAGRRSRACSDLFRTCYDLFGACFDLLFTCSAAARNRVVL
ncbi:MAG: hypothetical protein ACHP84_07765 [Caulobacterales bacterium]